MAEGGKVVTWDISANRDPEVFPEARPVRRDTPAQHVTFGPGATARLGRAQPLERKILFQELLPRVRSIELAGPVERSARTSSRPQADAGAGRDPLTSGRAPFPGDTLGPLDAPLGGS